MSCDRSPPTAARVRLTLTKAISAKRHTKSHGNGPGSRPAKKRDTPGVRYRESGESPKKSVRSILQRVAFGVYLPGIEVFLDFRLHEPLSNERQMLFGAIENLRSDDVLLLDRGFPCRWLVSALTARAIPFCIRCDLSQGFKAVREFMRSGQSEQVVVLRAPDARDAECYECPATPTTVRLLRVVTPKGRVHVVMTSLLDPVAFPVAVFADLYHGRWRIAEAFKKDQEPAWPGAYLGLVLAHRASGFRGQGGL